MRLGLGMVVLHVLIQLLEVLSEAVFHESVAYSVLHFGQSLDLLGHLGLRHPDKLSALVSARCLVDEVLDLAQKFLSLFEDVPYFTGSGEVVRLLIL